eukprot:CAMPEP_0170834106 /NCGR_PEP_ID=MMETSP0734-20130129/748_1 /TAXON_ID=186038 /ORGANISM="Fragilariopsis kerguelensis, Strain L26-C5" /LENGTH=91 /DNA_ID=CAMNT_0011200587 /DNA_START=293 /DNA_END=566 /DNA_ORIENTATION=-
MIDNNGGDENRYEENNDGHREIEITEMVPVVKIIDNNRRGENRYEEDNDKHREIANANEEKIDNKPRSPSPFCVATSHRTGSLTQNMRRAP